MARVVSTVFVTEFKRNLIHRAFLISGLAVYLIAAAFIWFSHASPDVYPAQGIIVVILGLIHSAFLMGISPDGSGLKRIERRFEVHICIHVILVFGLIVVTGGAMSPFKLYLPFAVTLVSYAFGNIFSAVSLIGIMVAYTLLTYTAPSSDMYRILLPHLSFFAIAAWIGYYLARIQNQANLRIAKALLNLEDAVAAEQAFHEAGKALVSNIGLAETLQIILNYAIKLVDGSSGCIGTWDVEKAKGTYATISGLPVLEGMSFDASTGVFGRVAVTAEPILIEDYLTCPYRLDFFEQYQVGSFIAIPLQFGGQLLGVLGIFNRPGDKPFGQQHLLLLQTFADLAASAINRAHLYQEVSTKSEQLAALLTISQQIACSLDQNDILQTVLNTALKHSLAKDGFICLISDDGTQIQKVATINSQEQPAHQMPVSLNDNPILAQLINSKEMMELNIPDDAERPSCLKGLDAQNVILVPLLGRERVMGALVCGKDSDEGFDQSAKDFLVQLALSAAIAIDNARLYQKIHTMAICDPLTGLFNRRLLFKDLERESKLSLRRNSCLTFMMMDIDDFKLFNDLHGHQAGDYILRSFAEILRGELRETDLIYRYGGEEFCLILSGIGKQEANAIANRIHAALTREELGITVSIGLATFPEDSESIQELISIADSAMYRAKKAGKNNTSA